MSKFAEKTNLFMPLELKKAIYKDVLSLQPILEYYLIVAQKDPWQVYLKLLGLLQRTLKIHLPIVKVLQGKAGGGVSAEKIRSEISPGLERAGVTSNNEIIVYISPHILSVATNKDAWVTFCKKLLSTLEHEYIHTLQLSRDKRTPVEKSVTVQPSSANEEFKYLKYISDPREIAAYSSNIVDELLDYFSKEEILATLSSTDFEELLEYSPKLEMYYYTVGPEAEKPNLKVWKKLLLFISLRVQKELE